MSKRRRSSSRVSVIKMPEEKPKTATSQADVSPSAAISNNAGANKSALLPSAGQKKTPSKTSRTKLRTNDPLAPISSRTKLATKDSLAPISPRPPRKSSSVATRRDVSSSTSINRLDQVNILLSGPSGASPIPRHGATPSPSLPTTPRPLQGSFHRNSIKPTGNETGPGPSPSLNIPKSSQRSRRTSLSANGNSTGSPEKASTHSPGRSLYSTSHHSPQRKKKGVNMPPPEDPTTSLLQTLTEVNTLDIWLQKKGGEFDIFDGKLVVHPGNYHPKKDFITVRRIAATERPKRVPELKRLEKINGDVYDFSTNRKQLKQPVDVWLPCHPITHPNLQEVKLKAQFKDEEEWVYHDWTLYGDDPTCPVMEFQTDRLGTFVATVEPRVERVTVTDQGLLYNARLNKYISLRFPKKSVDRDTHIEIRIIPFNMEKALIVKEEFKFNHPDLNDFELATDYFEIIADEDSTFRRSVSIKIPTNSDGFTEEYRDGIIIMRKDTQSNQWNVVDSNIKITKTTVSFDSKLLGSKTPDGSSSPAKEQIFSLQFDTKLLGRFIVLRAPGKRKLRMKTALPLLETKMTKCRREFVIFKKLLKKSWNIWIELVKPSQVRAVISKREAEGIICISQPEHISTDLDGKPEYSMPVNKQIEPSALLALTESEMDFSNNMMSRKNSSSDFVNIYDVESDENLNVKARPSTRRPSNIKGIAKKEYSYLEIDDGSFCGLVEIEGGVQKVDEEPLRPYFVENHEDNVMTFEFEPKEVETEGDIEATVKYYVENTSAADGLVTKSLMRECKLTITAEQVADYFWVEPEPEPVIEESETERSEVPSELLAAREAAAKIEAMRSQQDKAKDQVEITRRLSMPVKPKQIIYREPRVLSGRSLQTLSRMIEEGLTLAVYLDMPDSTITGIGFDALSNGLSLADVTYRILLRWKRSTKARGAHAVDELSNALRGMGRHDIVAIITESHHRNLELTPASFAGLDADDDNEETEETNLHKRIVPVVKELAL